MVIAEGILDKSQVTSALKSLTTVQDWIRWGVSKFNKNDVYFGHGYDNPWDEARALVLYALHLPPSTDNSVHPCHVTPEERTVIADLFQLRIENRVPTAYIMEQAWFCGLPFYIDERVLVPRSPFAELIESRFEPWLTKTPEKILDLCTGSACIAIACAKAFPNAEVDALDISPDALEVAEINIEQHREQDRVFPMQSNLYSAVQEVKYDLIVTNPPYVDAEDMDDMPQEFHHEPELGLAAGQDGLDLVRTILMEGPDHLNDNGLMFIEVGNSMVHMEEAFPGLEIQWLEFQHGGLGVFVVTKEALVKFFEGNAS